MRNFYLESRTDAPAYFDMACRWGPTARPSEERSGFRVGDRAGAYVQLAVWRRENPTRHLTVLEDPFLPNVGKAHELPAAWFTRELADRVIELGSGEEPLIDAPGEALHLGNVWTPWSEIARNPGKVPVPTPEFHYQMRGRAKRELHLLNEPNYVTVQPLFDATYDVERNVPIARWQEICAQLACHVPVVVVGSVKVASHCPMPWPIRHLWRENLHFQETLTLIQDARVHIGGETGTTLWAPLLRTPTVALYNSQQHYPAGLWWHRPISFGEPVVIHGMEDPMERIVEAVLALL